MASTYHISTTLKAAQLKQVAFKCGLQITGTKPTLISRLHHEITSLPASSKEPMTILSIDMGIRNLAYCILALSPKSKASKGPPSPILQSWHRLAVSSAPQKATDDAEDTAVLKEAFDPATLSTAAYDLLRNRLLLHKPTHVLIERQRFRSMGSKHILEWTIRVNMFESILYATLHTLKAEGVWQGTVTSIAPGKVGPFWIDDAVEPGLENADGALPSKREKLRKTQNAKIKNKGAKMDLVRNWLESADVVQLGNEAVRKMALAYQEKWDRAPGARKGGKLVLGKGEEKMGKLDDLADCLLQGMAWIRWEENKRIALNGGVEALLDP